MAAPSRLNGRAAAGQAPDTRQLTMIVENMHCGACLAKVERTLLAMPGVVGARANLTARRVQAEIVSGTTDDKSVLEALKAAGYQAAEMATLPPDAAARRERQLLARIAVAGFAATNIMLLSVSVWAGVFSDMDAPVMSLFHGVSALIALPAIAYAGQPFFASAAQAIGARRLNMDVPISVAISLATAMSLLQTWRGSEQVYFDAAVTLLFLLLIGRFLDQRVRVKAQGAAQNLMALQANWADVVADDGTTSPMPARLLSPGMRVHVATGSRIPVDGVVRSGRSDVDESLITGETSPRAVGPGDRVHAGTLSMLGTLTVEATATEGDTLLAEIARLMAAAEQGRGRYVRMADRAARIYAPAVHLLGLATFLGWFALGYGWEQGLTAAIAVLIITCPCALALAVPAVQIAAAHRLFKRGLIVKTPDALERLAEIDTVVLDKTGTLTTGEAALSEPDTICLGTLRAAAVLATASRHPYARALLRAATTRLGPIAIGSDVTEHPGLGLSRMTAAGVERLGSASFVLGTAQATAASPLWFSRPGHEAAGFSFSDSLRPDAKEVVTTLKNGKFAVELLSGDQPDRVAAAAAAAGIPYSRARQEPAGKIARLAALKEAGHRVLMVGDGLNDAPALAAGHASLSPAEASDISRSAADVIWQGASLSALTELLGVARETRRLALQNFAIAAAYNAVCVPLAMLGYVTPLIAAVAMSTSSIAVTLNALRLTTKPCHPEAYRS